MPEPDDLSFDALLALLKEKSMRPCPACGNPEWGPALNPLFVQAMDKSGTEILDGGWRAVALFCTNCGLMHLHNYMALAEEDEEVVDDPGDDDSEAESSNQDI